MKWIQLRGINSVNCLLLKRGSTPKKRKTLLKRGILIKKRICSRRDRGKLPSDAQRGKGALCNCGQRRPRSACAFAQADQGFRCLQKKLMDNVEYVYKQECSDQNCTDVHAELHLRCPQIASGPFSQVAHHSVDFPPSLWEQIISFCAYTPFEQILPFSDNPLSDGSKINFTEWFPFECNCVRSP